MRQSSAIPRRAVTQVTSLGRAYVANSIVVLLLPKILEVKMFEVATYEAAVPVSSAAMKPLARRTRRMAGVARLSGF
jgi:hypothetical protein